MSKKDDRKALIPEDAGGHSDKIAFSGGKYIWSYDLPLFKNPVVFLLIFKIFAYICIGLSVFLMLIEIGSHDPFAEILTNSLKAGGLVLAILTGLLIVGYTAYAIYMGGVYSVVFEMDEKSISHIQTPAQQKKAEKLSNLTVTAGAAAKDPTAVGIGLNSRKYGMASEFGVTKKVRALRAFGTIKLDGLLSHNQIYVPREDFDFVLGFIRERVPEKGKTDKNK